MIRSNRGNVAIEGTKSAIAVDLACIFRSLMEEDVGFDKEDIAEILELSVKDDEHLAEEAADVLVEALKAAIEALTKNAEKENSDAES